MKNSLVKKLIKEKQKSFFVKCFLNSCKKLTVTTRNLISSYLSKNLIVGWNDSLKLNRINKLKQRKGNEPWEKITAEEHDLMTKHWSRVSTLAWDELHHSSNCNLLLLDSKLP